MFLLYRFLVQAGGTIPMQTIDWRSPHFHEQFDRYDRADFAQEFLRRNPDYRRDYHEATVEPNKRKAHAALSQIADRWGLLCCFRP